MDECKVSALIENEKEWRRHVVQKIDVIENRLSDHMAWQLVFRVIGASLFAILIALIELKK